MEAYKKLGRFAFYIILLFSLFALYRWRQFLTTPLPLPAQSLRLEVKPGTPFSTLANELHKAGLLAHPRWWLLWAYLKGETHLIQSGEYQLISGLTPKGLLADLVEGNVIRYHVTFIEGSHFKDWMKILNKNPILKHTLKGSSPQAIMKKVTGHSDLAPEGQFFPSTYQFIRGDTDLDLLQMAYGKMQTVLDDFWLKRDKKLPFHSKADPLIIASLLEKEAVISKERQRIAGVILKRLKIHMPLQVDAAVIYGLKGKFDGHLNYRELAINTPYNLYLHRGLPPTPIASPSKNALWAAFHPIMSDALYYVSKGDGTHVFSATLAQHRKAKAKRDG